MKKLKVLILHNGISPYRNPLFEELSKKYDLEVWFCRGKDEQRSWSNSFENYSFKYQILPFIEKGSLILNPTLNKELKKIDFDFYVFFENPENIFSINKVIQYAKKKRKKLICVNGKRDDESYARVEDKYSSNLIKRFLYSLSKFIYLIHRKKAYLKSNSIIAYGTFAKNYLISKKIDSKKIFAGIQNMPESLLAKPTWKTKPKEFKNKKIILYLGYLRKMKGINYLIEAFNGLNRTDTILLIVGTGEYEEELKKLSKENLNIHFIGYKEGVEKANYFSISDFFVFPTLFDTYSHVVAESFYYNIPIISTDKDGANELITEGKTGFIIPSEDSNAIANAMKKLLDNPKLLRQMKEDVKKIPKSKIVDINTGVKNFAKAINYAVKNENKKSK